MLGILTVLAGWSWWLTQEDITPAPQSRETGSDDGLAYYVRDFTIVTMNPAGQLTRSLSSESLNHFLTTEITLLDKPRLKIFAIGDSPEWRLRANHGRVSGDGEELFLSGDVKIDRESRAEDLPLQILTSEITIQPDKDYAETDAPVSITQGDSKISSTGMQAWLKEPGHIKFNSKTRGYYANP